VQLHKLTLSCGPTAQTQAFSATVSV